MRRFQTLLVAFCVALQAFDGVVGALGHSHVEPNWHSFAFADSEHCHLEREHSQPADSPGDEHDDCSLCRHFSQPVVVATISVEIGGSQAIEPVTPPIVECIIAAVPTTHSARGPPVRS